MVDYNKFPSVLKNALKNEGLEFPEETQYEYKPIITFRGIQRAQEIKDSEIDSFVICWDDFKSYAELGKKPRGCNTNNASYYSCSLFLSEEPLKAALKLPKPNKIICKGKIIDDYGPVYINYDTGHVDLWLYKNATPEKNFHVIKRW